MAGIKAGERSAERSIADSGARLRLLVALDLGLGARPGTRKPFQRVEKR